jgi:hypothetical protein
MMFLLYPIATPDLERKADMRREKNLSSAFPQNCPTQCSVLNCQCNSAQLHQCLYFTNITYVFKRTCGAGGVPKAISMLSKKEKHIRHNYKLEYWIEISSWRYTNYEVNYCSNFHFPSTWFSDPDYYRHDSLKNPRHVVLNESSVNNLHTFTTILHLNFWNYCLRLHRTTQQYIRVPLLICYVFRPSAIIR